MRALVGGRGYNDRLNNGYFNRAILARRQAGSTFKPFFYACGFEHGLLPTSTFYDGPITFADGYSPKNYEKKFFGATSLRPALEKPQHPDDQAGAVDRTAHRNQLREALPAHRRRAVGTSRLSGPWSSAPRRSRRSNWRAPTRPSRTVVSRADRAS